MPNQRGLDPRQKTCIITSLEILGGWWEETSIYPLTAACIRWTTSCDFSIILISQQETWVPKNPLLREDIDFEASVWFSLRTSFPHWAAPRTSRQPVLLSLWIHRSQTTEQEVNACLKNCVSVESCLMETQEGNICGHPRPSPQYPHKLCISLCFLFSLWSLCPWCVFELRRIILDASQYLPAHVAASCCSRGHSTHQSWIPEDIWRGTRCLCLGTQIALSPWAPQQSLGKATTSLRSSACQAVSKTEWWQNLFFFYTNVSSTGPAMTYTLSSSRTKLFTICMFSTRKKRLLFLDSC